MVKIVHKFFKTFQKYQRAVLIVIFSAAFGAGGVAVLTASFASSTSIINGYKVDQSGSTSNTRPEIARVPVEYTAHTPSGNTTPQSANPYSFNNLPQGLHQISIYSATIPAGWVPSYSLCWEDGSCRNPNSTPLTYEAGPNRYTVVVDTSGHTVAHLWFHFRQNPPAVSLSVNPSSIAYGGSTTVSWSSTNSPTSCSNNFGGSNNGSGSATLGNLTASRSFTVTCSNSGGTGSNPPKSVTVGAKPNPPAPPPPTSPPPSTGGSPSTNPRPPLQGSTNVPTSAGSPADTTPPSAPATFLAEAASDEPFIDLSWEAASDGGGIRAYQLERSIDQQNWTVVAQDINDIFYTDEGLTFATHYYYRVKAIDNSNNSSDYAQTDATTAGFESNVTKDGGGTINSENKQASVVFPAGAFDQDTYCDLINPRELGAAVKGFELASGPYQLLCQTADGTLITEFKLPAKANITLDPSQRKKYSATRYYEKDGDNWKHVLGANDSIELNNTGSFALYGKRKTTPIWIKIIIVLLVIVGIAAAVLGLLYLRYRRGLQAKADDYWRKSKGF